jgi:hypothetical protein
MGLPKKIKKDLKLTPEKILLERREELLENINEDGTYLPKSILHADLDRGFLDFVKTVLRTVVEGKEVPMIDVIITTQNWAQFTETWKFQNMDDNPEPPFITIVRKKETKFGTNPALKYNIPNRRQYFYAAVPTWTGTRKGVDIYTIPQPIPIDINYSIKIVCNRMRELNEFNKNVLREFASRQAYATVKGHYIPIVMDRIEDNTPMDTLDGRRFYIQNYGFTMLGFLIDDEEFEVSPAINRSITMVEPDLRTIYPVKRKTNNITIQSEYTNGSIIANYTATSQYKVDKTVEITFTDSLVTTGTPITQSVRLFIERNQLSGTTEYTITENYNQLSGTTSFKDVNIDTIGRSKYEYTFTTGSTFN